MTPGVRSLAAALVLLAGAARAESLYQPDRYVPLTSDRRARGSGDVLTIQVYENASASSSTDTSTARSNALEAAFQSTAVNGGSPFAARGQLSGEFDGGGTTQRASRLLATLTVTVRQVMPNGDLIVAGEQLVTINDEEQHVVVTGRVRPQDVSADNVVLSTRLADARIEYDGEGHLSERTRRPWWRRLLDWIGL
jgi:flagellar L-ring protein precursor FlgH